MSPLSNASLALAQLQSHFDAGSITGGKLAIIAQYLDAPTVDDLHHPGTRITAEQFHALYGCRQPQAEVIRAMPPTPTPNPLHDQIRAEVRTLHGGKDA